MQIQAEGEVNSATSVHPLGAAAMMLTQQVSKCDVTARGPTPMGLHGCTSGMRESHYIFSSRFRAEKMCGGSLACKCRVTSHTASSFMHLGSPSSAATHRFLRARGKHREDWQDIQCCQHQYTPFLRLCFIWTHDTDMNWHDKSESRCWCVRNSGSPLFVYQTVFSFSEIRLCVAICSWRGNFCHQPCFTSA